MKNNLFKKNLRESIIKIISNFIYRIKTMSFAKHILVFYLIITIVGALLLWAPFTQTGRLKWDPVTNQYIFGNMSFIDSLFTAASAFSDTGLATNSTVVVYNGFGQAIVAILIFVGGLGWFALKVFIFNIIFGRPISFRTIESLSAERGSTKPGITRELIRVAIITLLMITIFFSIILSIVFYYIDISENSSSVKSFDGNVVTLKNDKLILNNPHKNAINALKFGIFHTISALNNAGFDIIGNSSLSPYYFAPSIQIIFMFLFMIGGMGYPVIYDLYRYIKCKRSGKIFRASLFTKLSVITYFIISLIGVGTTFIIEVANRDSFWKADKTLYGSQAYKSLALIFNTMSTRNAGFSTISMHALSAGTKLIYMIMMFIGSAPSSTAGGIRTTTFAILILGIFSLLRGKKGIYVFKIKISKEIVNRAFIVFATSIGIAIMGMLISLTSIDSFGGKIPTLNHLTDSGKKSLPAGTEVYSFHEIMFEVFSAFGTTGLSNGLTEKLSIYSKLSLILIMFIGQLGISSSILIWGSKKKVYNHYNRVSEVVSIG